MKHFSFCLMNFQSFIEEKKGKSRKIFSPSRDVCNETFLRNWTFKRFHLVSGLMMIFRGEKAASIELIKLRKLWDFSIIEVFEM